MTFFPALSTGYWRSDHQGRVHQIYFQQSPCHRSSWYVAIFFKMDRVTCFGTTFTLCSQHTYIVLYVVAECPCANSVIEVREELINHFLWVRKCLVTDQGGLSILCLWNKMLCFSQFRLLIPLFLFACSVISYFGNDNQQILNKMAMFDIYYLNCNTATSCSFHRRKNM